MIPLDDRGLTLGDGLFETLLARDGELAHLDAHLDRLTAGCAALGMPAPDRVEAVALMRAAIVGENLGDGLCAVRLTLTAGSGGRGLDRPALLAPRMFASASAYRRPAGPLTLATSPIRRNADSPASALKTLGYLDGVLARRAAMDAGAEDALMLNTRGEVACATAANVFWIAGGRLVTPSADCAILPGIMRAAAIAAAASRGVDVVEAKAGPQALATAEAIFITNSLVGVRPVSVLDGRALSSSALVEALAADLV